MRFFECVPRPHNYEIKQAILEESVVHNNYSYRLLQRILVSLNHATQGIFGVFGAYEYFSM
jgi:hypothetical protein